MKRFFALILSVFLLAACMMPSVMAENDLSAGVEMEEETPSPADPVQEEEPEKPAEQLTAGESLTAQLVRNAPASINTASMLRFTELRTVLDKYNNQVRALKATLSDLSAVDTKELRDLADLMTSQSNALQETLQQVQTVLANPDLPDDQKLIYGALAQSLGAGKASLQGQIQTLENQIDSIDTSAESGANTAGDAINQIVKGAETMYISILTMEASVNGLQRSIDTLDRAVAITEKQESLGMASAYDVESIRYQRAQAISGLESLKFGIKSYKMNLENLCGMELKGTVSLEALTMPTEEELAGVNYEKNLQSATRRNVDVMNAEDKRFHDDGNAAEYSYRAAVDAFACSYKIVCITVPEKNRLVQTAQETVDYQQRTFEIAEKKYSLGMLSYEEYMSAKNSLLSAKDDLYSAQLELFTAYRNYIWATQYGIA